MARPKPADRITRVADAFEQADQVTIGMEINGRDITVTLKPAEIQLVASACRVAAIAKPARASTRRSA